MILETHLVKALEKRENYARLSKHLKNYTLSKPVHDVATTLNDYFDNYPQRDTVDWDEFKTFFHIIKGKKLKDATLYEGLFEQVAAITSSPVVDDVLKKLVESDYATRIYDECLGIATGRAGASLDNVGPIYEQYLDEQKKVDVDDLFVPVGLHYITKTATGPSIDWRLEEFNVSLGPLRKGDFVAIVARPETGKTTLIAEQVSFALEELVKKSIEGPILWVNNEEGGDKVMSRAIQSYFGVTNKDLEAKKTFYEDEFKKAFGDRLRILADDSGVNSINALTALIKKLKPALIVFDVLDKVGSPKKDRDDLELAAKWLWARDIAKTYCPVIAVSQASETAENTMYIEQNQLRGSRTDKAAECDAIITIGRLHFDAIPNRRYINIAKNKLWGGPRSLEPYRHGRFEVEIDPPIARYTSKWKLKSSP